MTRPAVSASAEDLYRALGPIPAGDEGLGWPLLLFCATVIAPVGVVADLASDSESQVGWGPILDPRVCPADALPWLGQLVGAQVPVGAPEVTARAIVSHSPGRARGTPASVLAAARLWLTGAQHATLTERFGGSAYAVRLTVYAAEVVDLVQLTAAVKASLPAGFTLTVTVLAGWTIAEMESETTTIAAAEAAFATINDFETQIP